MKKFCFTTITVLLVAAMPLILVEFILAFVSGPWPYREVRPEGNYRAVKVEDRERPHDSGAIDPRPIHENSWGFRDYRRTVAKEPGRHRILAIGDSFLEGGFCRFPLPALLENDLFEKAKDDIEVINLGVSGTRPMEYYFRLRDFGRSLSPDAVTIFFYSGNDFRDPAERYSSTTESSFSRFVERRPIPSMLGAVTPRFSNLLMKGYDALIVKNRLLVPHNEFALLNDYIRLPYEQGMDKITEYVKKVYYPRIDKDRIREILTRGGSSFWSVFAGREFDREYLQGWVLNNLVKWELTETYAKNEAEAAKSINDGEVSGALSWLEATARLCREMGIPLRVFVIPMGTVDPEFREFYKPWPAYFSYNYICDAKHTRLVELLQASAIPFVDLRPVLDGIGGTYRKIDMHWTEKGHRVVADAMGPTFLELAGGRKALTD